MLKPNIDDLLGLSPEYILQQFDEDYLLAYLLLCYFSGVGVLFDIEGASVPLALELLQNLL